MRKLDQTPTSMIELRGALKQLLLDVDERVNSSWERAETVRIARNADEFGTSAVQRQTGQGFGRTRAPGAGMR